MKASEITNERLQAIISDSYYTTYPDEGKALAQAELDRRKVEAPVVKLINYHTKECAFWSDCHNGFDHPRACDCGADERKLAATKPAAPVVALAIEGKPASPQECIDYIEKCKPVAEAPVVKWWKHRYYDGTCKTENGIITETTGSQELVASGILPALWTEITEAEYLAATKPAAPVVEPWVNMDSGGCGYSDITEAIKQLQRRLEAVEQAQLCRTIKTVEDNHDSDCATHNMPYKPNGRCDCRLKPKNLEAVERSGK